MPIGDLLIEGRRDARDLEKGAECVLGHQITSLYSILFPHAELEPLPKSDSCPTCDHQ